MGARAAGHREPDLDIGSPVGRASLLGGSRGFPGLIPGVTMTGIPAVLPIFLASMALAAASADGGSLPALAAVAECGKGDCQDGFGVATLADGDRYEGGFVGGRPHGHGVLVRTSPRAFVVRAGTFEGGASKESPKNEALLQEVSLRIAALKKGLPDVLASARDGFSDAWSECAPAPPEGGTFGREWCATALGKKHFAQGPHVERDGDGQAAAWVNVMARSGGADDAATWGMATCATVAAVLGKSGDPWQAPRDAQATERCEFVAGEGPYDGVTVKVLPPRKDAEGRLAVTLAVYATKRSEG